MYVACEADGEALPLGIVQSAELGGSLPEIRVGLEDGAGTLSLRSNDPSHFA